MAAIRSAKAATGSAAPRKVGLPPCNAEAAFAIASALTTKGKPRAA